MFLKSFRAYLDTILKTLVWISKEFVKLSMYATMQLENKKELWPLLVTIKNQLIC